MEHIVAIIDGGGRGSALVQKYATNTSVKKIIAIPGNDLMQSNASIPVHTFPDIKTTNIQEIISICKKERVTFVDVAQDNAIAVGLVDALEKNGISAFGPTKIAGEIEWNKAYARLFMRKYRINQPEFKIFHDVQDAYTFLDAQPEQSWFVKASGLADGKGALPANSNQEAKHQIIELQRFGEAAKVFLLEKWLRSKQNASAEEFSAFALCDGKRFIILGYAQDHKRAFDGDRGENTGGMGCSTPPLVITKNIHRQVSAIFEKTLTGLAAEGRQYKGILYVGGIIQGNSVFVIEYNARWGDPEAEVLLPSLQEDYFEIVQKASQGNLSRVNHTADGKTRVAVAATAKGYPVDYTGVIGKEIYGIEKVMKLKDTLVFGAGVRKIHNKYYVNGGRLFYIVGTGNSVKEARQLAYHAMDQISIDDDMLHFRTDIGWRDLQRI